MLQDLIEVQKKRLLAHARRLLPHLTPDDILQPNDFPELEVDPLFRYEEGYLAGLLAADLFIRRELRQSQ